MNMFRILASIASMTLLGSGLAIAADAPTNTRYMVTINKLKPGSADSWRKVYLDSVVPALKKAGVSSFSMSEQLFGERQVYVHIRPLEKWSELDGPGPLQRANLPQKQVDSINAVRNAALVSEDRFIVNALPELMVPTASDALIRVVQFYRPNPGQGDLLRALLRSDVLPAWQRAKQAGRIAGAGVATSGQGKPGLYIIWVDYTNLAALDAGNMLQQTMGEPAYAHLQARVAQLAQIEESGVSRRIPELSYSSN